MPREQDALKAIRELCEAEGMCTCSACARGWWTSLAALMTRREKAAVEAARLETERLQHIVDLLTDEFVRYNLPQTGSVEDAIKALVSEIGRRAKEDTRQ